MQSLSDTVGKAFFVFILGLSANVYGTHIRSAEIIVERIDCSTLTYRIKVIAYINTVSQTPFGGNTFEDGSLDFGDGTYTIIPTTATTPRSDLGPNIGTAQFVTTHTYAQAGDYKINYFERDRSAAILNIFNPGDTPFSSYVLIRQLSMQYCDKYPALNFPPIDKTCPGVIFFHNSGAVDADGDSLSYELTVPSKNSTTSVDGYFSPASQQFYTNYNQGNEDKNGTPTFSIDGRTGLITWNAPGRVGEYNIAFKILEWRTNPTTGIPELLSTTIRDMQITVEDCINGRPELIVPEDICIVAGTIIDAKILGFDPENNKVKIEFSSDAFGLLDSPPEINPSAVDYRNSVPHDTVRFHWQTNCSHVREQAYQFVIKISDKPNFGAQLVTFKTWQIKIIAPIPIWKNVSLDLVKRKSVLEWEPYVCTNVKAVQVWRKVGHYNDDPAECDAGLPKYLGYELIAEVDPQLTTFVDNNSSAGLVDGALYCYRLVAIFALPPGGKSYVTTEQCVGPIETDAPVITNVTVEKTSNLDGSIRISWRSPFKIDKILFPKPYQYLVYRGDGFKSENNLKRVGVVSDTTFLDVIRNTVDSAYNYRLVVYSKPDGYEEYIPVDTSFAASSVRLQASPQSNKIQLEWQGKVPWSNVIDGSPYHIIYRGLKNDAELTFLAKADVTENGFQWEDTSVKSNEYYCYAVMTRGSYGNPAIDTLRNFSQRICLYPKNDLPPCTPSLAVDQINCDDLLALDACTIEYKNSLTWTIEDDPGCRIDIVGYNIYVADDLTGEFALLRSNIAEFVFKDTNLTSFAKCYKVTSIDTQNHESAFSEVSCNDNCPFFDVPNVFTPEKEDGCNDAFRAVRSFEGEVSPCGAELCLPFINDLSLKVYNRWGKEVYASQTASGLPLNLDWKGIGNNGEKLEGGIYYYLIDVQFNVLDESKRYKSIRGWVHLVR